MILCVPRLQNAFKVTAVALLGVALSWPALSQTTASKKPVAKKAVVVKTSERNKATPVATLKAKASVAAKKSTGTRHVEKAEARKAVRASQPAAKTGKRERVILSAKAQRPTLKKVSSKRAVSAAAVRVAAPVTLMSAGERLGLRRSDDALDLNSSVALVVDQDSGEVLFSKNESAVLPIASLTKLMTGLVIADANLPMDEMITITQDDVDTYKGSRSRLAVGSTLSRGEMMHLALMSSENRAAHALGRTFPSGMQHFVKLMNSKAQELGMNDTRYVEPTGLLSWNQSSARDLATLVSVAYQRPILRELSTSPSHQLDVGSRTLQYNNSNRLIRNPEWDIGLQKTGYISEAGRCLVMQAKIAGRKLIMVFLDSSGKLGRSQDAERVRRWIEAQTYQQLFARPQG
jgi:D-alanyl-D-alanine endopeptidase (penicillin-binding protein 7)